MAEREMGNGLISIGTSIAVDALNPNNVLLPDENAASHAITRVMFNITTLIRNYFASMTKEQYQVTDANEAYQDLVQEIERVEQSVKAIPKKTELVWYWQDARLLEMEFPNVEFKTPTTDRQIEEAKRWNVLTEALYEYLSGQRVPQAVTVQTLVYENDAHVFYDIGREPKRELETVGIITHEPHHLLWESKYKKLFLVESHTGSIKSTATFYTKLATLKKGERMPFNKVSLVMFGDNVHFKPVGIKIRRELLEIAERKKWSLVTSTNGMYLGIKDLGTDLLKNAYATLCKFI